MKKFIRIMCILIISIGALVFLSSGGQKKNLNNIGVQYDEWMIEANKSLRVVEAALDEKHLNKYESSLTRIEKSIISFEELPNLDEVNKGIFPWIDPLNITVAFEIKEKLMNTIEKSETVKTELSKIKTGFDWTKNVEQNISLIQRHIDNGDVDNFKEMYNGIIEELVAGYDALDTMNKSLEIVEEARAKLAEYEENRTYVIMWTQAYANQGKIEKKISEDLKASSTVSGLYLDQTNSTISLKYDNTYKVKFTIENTENLTITYAKFDIRGFDNNGNSINTDWTNWSGNLKSGDKAIVECYFECPDLVKYSITIAEVQH